VTGGWRRVGVVVLVPLLVSAALIAILVAFFHPTFLVSDDATLSSLVNGDYTGKRTSSLVVAPAMFGHVLRLGYAAFPRVGWYGLTLYALQAVSYAVIGAAAFAIRRRPPVAERIVVAAAVLALMPWMVLRVSFTPTSLLVGTAGVVLLAVGARAGGRVGPAYAVGAGVLLGTAYVMRVYSFLAVVVIFAPVLAAIVVRAGLRRSVVFGLTVGVIVLVAFGADRLEYRRSAEWRAFAKTNSARSSLHDTPRLQDKHVSDEDLSRVGWTRNDLRLFASFTYPDPHVYGDTAIRTFASNSARVRNDVAPSDLWNVLVRDASDRGNDRGPTPALLIGVALVLALRWNRTVTMVTILSAAWYVGVLVALLLYVRLPGRILVPLEGAAVFVTALVPSYLTPTRPRAITRLSWAPAVLVGLVAVTVAVPAWRGVQSVGTLSDENERAMTARSHAIEELQALDPEGIFVARGDALGRWIDPLAAHSPFENPRLVPLGWSTNSPLFTARLARLGIDDLYSAIQTDPRVYVLAQPERAKRMSDFYRQHRDARVVLERTFRGIPVYLDTRSFNMDVWSATTRLRRSEAASSRASCAGC
jgi:hypothetical protein